MLCLLYRPDRPQKRRPVPNRREIVNTVQHGSADVVQLVAQLDLQMSDLPSQ